MNSGRKEISAYRGGQPPCEQERGADWNFARPGEPPLPELTAIVLARQPTLEEVFGHAEREIGTEPTTDLPPAPDEPGQDALSKSRRNLNRWLAKGVAGLARRVPHRGSRRTWINDVEDWAHRQLRGVEDQLQRLRNKELHRLLHLLAKDPLVGLRHAIPMNCFAHRGLGPRARS